MHWFWLCFNCKGPLFIQLRVFCLSHWGFLCHQAFYSQGKVHFYKFWLFEYAVHYSSSVISDSDSDYSNIPITILGLYLRYTWDSNAGSSCHMSWWRSVLLSLPPDGVLERYSVKLPGKAANQSVESTQLCSELNLQREKMVATEYTSSRMVQMKSMLIGLKPWGRLMDLVKEIISKRTQ